MQTIEINVDNELSSMESDKEIYINGKRIFEDGKEFLKLFGLKKWALKSGNRYIIPNYIDFDLSQNNTINECFSKLSLIDKKQLTEMLADEQYYMDIVNENLEEGYNKGKIVGEEEGYNKGKTEGEEEGYNKGKIEGMEEGYNKGKIEGMEEGTNFGLNNGLIIGAFSVFLTNSDFEVIIRYFKENNVKFGNETKVRRLLHNKDKGEVDQFIQYLKFNHAL